MVLGAYGTGNLKRHIKKCSRRNTSDVGQLLMSQNLGSLSVSASKFDTEKFRELWIASIIKHDLPFRFVEYEGIREMCNT
jgi:hypothetical protein